MEEVENKELALSIRKTGEVEVKNNINEFGIWVRKSLEKCDASKLETDQDFENAKLAIKAFTKVRAKIKEGIKSLDMDNIAEMKESLLDIDKDIQQTSSAFDKAIKIKREEKKLAIIDKVWEIIKAKKNQFEIPYDVFKSNCQLLMKSKSNFVNMEQDIAKYEEEVQNESDTKKIRYVSIKTKMENFYPENDMIRTPMEIETSALLLMKNGYTDEQVDLCLKNALLEEEKIRNEKEQTATESVKTVSTTVDEEKAVVKEWIVTDVKEFSVEAESKEMAKANFVNGVCQLIKKETIIKEK